MPKKLLTALTQYTLLPVANLLRRLLHGARVRKVWGDRAAGSLIDDDIDCWRPDRVTLGQKVTIRRRARFVVKNEGQIRIGNGAIIEQDVGLFAMEGDVDIGENTYIGWGTTLIAGPGHIRIGSNVLIAHGSSLLAQNYDISDAARPTNGERMMSEGIIIEDGVWIGTQVCILDGARVGRGSVIAAGAVVTKDVAPYSVMAGVPAELVKTRAVAAGQVSV